MSTNLEYRARETPRKRESGRQASEAQRENGRHRFGAREKKQRRHFFVGRTTRKFGNGGDKMRNASGHQCRMKMSGRGKIVNEKTYDNSSIKRVTKKFYVVVVQNNGKEITKKVSCTCKVALFLIRPIDVFHRSPALPSPLSITRFYILFEQTINIIESFAFSPG